MNYPVWYVPTFGGGVLIALVAIIHVFVSHFAVGGGLYLVMTEWKGIREQDQSIIVFVQKHTKFFLLLTMVFGGLTGVAIWFIISLIHPAATSLLIHTFVFGWAAEWVFFLVEIVALFIYFYTFGRMDDHTHQTIGWIYFGAAWMSLFLINGIIDFMLTPGTWLANHNFWDGFFNPTFWPSLFFRSFMSFMLAGCYGFITATFLEAGQTRHKMIRYSGIWALISLALSVPAGWWYISVLPEKARGLVGGVSPTIARAATVAAVSLAVLTGVVILLILLNPKKARTRVLTVIVMVAAMGYMGAFEWTREAARRPYVINDVMYSNGILKEEVEQITQKGFLKTAKWVQNIEVTKDNQLEAGRELFLHQCFACHTVGGFNNDIIGRTKNMSYGAMQKYLATIHEKRYFMPPLVGNVAELKALAAYIAAGLHKKPLTEDAVAVGDRGKNLFDNNCAPCHAAGVLKPKMAGWSKEKIRTSLDILPALNPAMPDYSAPTADKNAMSGYLHSLNNIGSAAAPPKEQGAALFEDNCAPCHGFDVLKPKVSGWSKAKIRAALDKLSALNPGMPDYTGAAAEKDSLADYMVKQAGGAK
ncbi:MAG: c-type cytochrome [Desulfuromonadaceae bacterium]|nr:c-type cytochrome [Desulfuromonadaceae bacterium]